MVDSSTIISVPQAPLSGYDGTIDDFLISAEENHTFPITITAKLHSPVGLDNNLTASTFSCQLLLPVEDQEGVGVSWDSIDWNQWKEGKECKFVINGYFPEMKAARILYKFREVQSWDGLNLKVIASDSNDAIIDERTSQFSPCNNPEINENIQSFLLDSGAYHTHYSGNSSIHHPKSRITQLGIANLFAESIINQFTLRQIVYLGLDTGENLFAAIRCLQSNGVDFSRTSIRIIGEEKWDLKYKKWLVENTEINSILNQHKDSEIILIGEDGISQLQDMEADLIIGTYVLQWALNYTSLKDANAENTFRNIVALLSSDGLYLSVEPKDVFDVHRGGEHAAIIDVDQWFGSFGLKKLHNSSAQDYQVLRSVWSRNNSVLRTKDDLDFSLRKYGTEWLESTKSMQIAGIDAKTDLLPLPISKQLVFCEPKEDLARRKEWEKRRVELQKETGKWEPMMPQPISEILLCKSHFGTPEPQGDDFVDRNICFSGYPDEMFHLRLLSSDNSPFTSDYGSKETRPISEKWGGWRGSGIGDFIGLRQELTTLAMRILLSRKNILLSGTAASGKSICSEILLRALLREDFNSTTITTMVGDLQVLDSTLEGRFFDSNAILCRAKDIISNWVEDNVVESIVKASCKHPRAPQKSDWENLHDLVNDPRTGQWLIIIDAFDEIWMRSNRIKLSEALLNLGRKHRIFITSRPSSVGELQPLMKVPTNWTKINVDSFGELDSRLYRKMGDDIDFEGQKFRILSSWDHMLMQAWGKEAGKFEPHAVKRQEYTGNWGGNASEKKPVIEYEGKWPSLVVKSTFTPTPQIRAELLADNIEYGKWDDITERSLNQNYAPLKKWNGRSYNRENFDIWAEVIMPRMSRQFELRISELHPELVEKPVLSALYRYHRVIAFLYCIHHRDTRAINSEFVRQAVASKLFDKLLIPNSLRTLPGDDLYKILFESSSVLYVSNDDDIEWHHKRFLEKFVADFLFQSDAEITQEYIADLLNLVGLDATQCSYPQAFDNENPIRWLSRLVGYEQKTTEVDGKILELQWSVFDEGLEPGLASECLIAAFRMHDDHFPRQNWGGKRTDTTRFVDLIHRKWLPPSPDLNSDRPEENDWGGIIQVALEFEKRANVDSPMLWRCLWTMHFNLLQRAGNHSLAYFLQRWEWLLEVEDLIVERASDDEVIRPFVRDLPQPERKPLFHPDNPEIVMGETYDQIGHELNCKEYAEKIISEIVPMHYLPLGFKSKVDRDDIPMVHWRMYDDHWGNSFSNGDTQIRDRLFDALQAVRLQILRELWANSTEEERTHVFYGDEVYDAVGNVVWYSEDPSMVNNLFRGDSIEQAKVEGGSSNNWIWGCVSGQFRYAMDIDGYSWILESSCEFGMELLKYTDFASHRLAHHLYEHLWGCSIDFFMAPRDMMYDLLNELVAPDPEIMLEEYVKSSIACWRMKVLHDALVEHSQIDMTQDIWNCIDWEGEFRTDGSSPQSSHLLLLSMAVMYDVSSEILFYAWNQPGYKFPKDSNIDQRTNNHHEDAIFSEIFTAADLIEAEPMDSANLAGVTKDGGLRNSSNSTIEKGTRVWVAPEGKSPTMEELRETFIHLIELNYECDSIHEYTKKKNQYGRMQDWIEYLYNRVSEILLTQHFDSNYMTDEINAFTKIWSQAVMIGQTALRLGSIPGMIISLGLIESCGVAIGLPIKIHSGNIRVRYSDSFSPHVEGKTDTDYEHDFVKHVIELRLELIEKLDSHQDGLGTRVSVEFRDLFPDESLEKFQRNAEIRRSDIMPEYGIDAQSSPWQSNQDDDDEETFI